MNNRKMILEIIWEAFRLYRFVFPFIFTPPMGAFIACLCSPNISGGNGGKGSASNGTDAISGVSDGFPLAEAGLAGTGRREGKGKERGSLPSIYHLARDGTR
jgi:hypothetical protein